MKIPYHQIFYLVLLAACTLSCTPEEDPASVPPTLTLTSDFFPDVNAMTVSAGSQVIVKVFGKAGSDGFSSLSIADGETLISANELTINGQVITSNPINLNTSEPFEMTVQWTSIKIAGKRTYNITLTDTKGLSVTKSCTVTTLITAPNIIEPQSDISLTRSPGTVVGTVFKVLTGTSDLASITFLLNGQAPANLSNLFVGQTQSPVTQNIISLTGNDAKGFNKEIYIKTPVASGTYIYTVLFRGVNGLEASRKIQITVGTPVVSLTGILANAAGGSTVGGLDLDSGASTSISATNPTSATAEIRDEGQVNPPSDKTWRQQISGMNGAEIKYLIPGNNGLTPGFTIEGVLYKEEISVLWDRGISFTEKSGDGVRLISAQAKTGDLFIVKSGSKYYLAKVTEIKATASDDKDQMIFAVKW